MSLNPDAIAVCPYDKAHSIVVSRMQFHLMKCRAQHPCVNMSSCPFNSTHIMNPVELEWHVQWCPDRIAGDQVVYAMGTASPFIQSPPPPVAPVTTNNEVWDEEEIECGGSVLERVKEVSQTKPNLTNKICAPRSERKAHKLQERRRFADVLECKSKSNDDWRSAKNDLPSENSAPKRQSSPPKPTSPTYEQPPPPRSVSSPQVQEPVVQQEKRNEYEVDNKEYPPMSSEPQRKRNPWGTSKLVSSSSFPSGESSSFQPAKGGAQSERPSAWGGMRAPPQSVDSATRALNDMRLSDKRDPGNPWKTRMAANFQGNTDANDFPVLPMSGRGRGRRDK